MNLEEARSFWKVAATFPADKEAVYPTHATAHEFHVQAGEEGAQLRPCVLEYGCGGGSDTISLLKRGARVFFVDIVPGNVALTRQRVAELPHGAPLRGLGTVLDVSDVLPFEDSLFDSVNCHGVLHHIEEETMKRVILEFRRVLRRSGHLYAMLYTEKLFKKLQTGIESLMAQGWPIDKAFSYFTDGGGIARPYSLGGGRELFESCGFEFVNAVEYNDGDFRTFKLKK